MNYQIKELIYDSIDDYMKVNTKSWQEMYRGIINDEFLDKINNEFDKNIKNNKMNFMKKNSLIKDIFYIFIISQLGCFHLINVA